MRWLWVALGLLAICFLPQLPGCARAFSPKVGKVVDEQGRGISDVTIIAVGKVFDGSSASMGETLYRVMATTESDGSYSIPGTWLQSQRVLPIRPPWFTPRVRWLISAIKPGYVFVGDDLVWTEYDEYGNPKRRSFTLRETPEAAWWGLTMAVAPLKLQQATLSIGQAADYYFAIFGMSAGGLDVSNPSDDARLRQKVSAFLDPMVCASSANLPISSHSVGSLSVLSADEQKVFKKLRSLEPEGFSLEMREPVLIDDYHHHEFKMGNVCEALKQAGIYSK